MHARISLDVRNPLVRMVSVKRGGERQIFRVMYEKLPMFCEVCGCLVHFYKECKAVEYTEKDFKFSSWLIVESPWKNRSWSGPSRGSSGRRGS